MKIIKEVERYLANTLEAPSNFLPWEEEISLPNFLREAYNFHQMDFLKAACLLMLAKPGTVPSPAAVKKHRDIIAKRWNGAVIFVQGSVSAYNRKRLVEHRIPFIVPGNQMYLPNLGIDFREHHRKPKTSKLSTAIFCPATQVVVLHALLSDAPLYYTIAQLHHSLGYTRMTLTRSFNELEAHNIGETFYKKRERIWSYNGTKDQLWSLAKLYLRNPIKRQVWIKNNRFKLQSGQSALADYTRLNPPKMPTYVLSPIADHNLKITEIETVSISDGADAELEIWLYDPALLTKEKRVDALSLYLIFRENKDERIQQALTEIMERLQW